MKKKSSKTKKSAQEIQDDIFRKMPAGKKLRLASDFSMFLLKLHQLNIVVGNTNSNKNFLMCGLKKGEVMNRQT